MSEEKKPVIVACKNDDPAFDLKKGQHARVLSTFKGFSDEMYYRLMTVDSRSLFSAPVSLWDVVEGDIESIEDVLPSSFVLKNTSKKKWAENQRQSNIDALSNLPGLPPRWVPPVETETTERVVVECNQDDLKRNFKKGQHAGVLSHYTGFRSETYYRLVTVETGEVFTAPAYLWDVVEGDIATIMKDDEEPLSNKEYADRQRRKNANALAAEQRLLSRSTSPKKKPFWSFHLVGGDAGDPDVINFVFFTEGKKEPTLEKVIEALTVGWNNFHA